MVSESIVTIYRQSGVSESAKVKAGLACYEDEHRYARVFYEASSSEVVSELVNNAQKIRRTVHSLQELTRRMTYTERGYTLFY